MHHALLCWALRNGNYSHAQDINLQPCCVAGRLVHACPAGARDNAVLPLALHACEPVVQARTRLELTASMKASSQMSRSSGGARLCRRVTA